MEGKVHRFERDAPFEIFEPSETAKRKLAKVKLRAHWACEYPDDKPDQKSTMKDIRFDTRIRLHQFHTLKTSCLATLHHMHRQASIREISRLGRTEYYYRQAAELRLRLSVISGRPSRHRVSQIHTGAGMQRLLYLRRFQLFRAGLE